MVFNSIKFLVFLLVFIVIYTATPKKFQNIITVLGNCVFLYMGIKEYPLAKNYTILFILTIFLNFIIGEFIEKFRKSSGAWLKIGIGFNLWWLLFFKYSGFFIENVNLIFITKFPVKDIVLPLGISFYTFQNISYIIDVYQKKIKAEKNILRYFIYISLFPKFLQGPITRYGDISEEIRKRNIKSKEFLNGIRMFIVGLGYKVILADHIGKLWKDINNIGYENISTQLAWLGIIAYSLKIFLDFNGYSMMAVGIGKMMGFTIPKNFDYPYMSATMTEFWRRWHITLGAWFRDYVYIPLGGNKCNRITLLRNLLIVWLLTGLWHGASWHFILWGFAIFVIIAIEKLFTFKFMEKHRFIGHIFMLFLIPLTWLIFAVNDVSGFWVYFKRLFPFIEQAEYIIPEKDYVKYFSSYKFYLLFGLLFSTPLPEIIYKKNKDDLFIKLSFLAILVASIVFITKLGVNDPFMYANF